MIDRAGLRSCELRPDCLRPLGCGALYVEESYKIVSNTSRFGSNPLFLKSRSYSCIERIRLGSLPSERLRLKAWWAKLAPRTATERWGRSMLVIAALSALSWAVVIGIVIAALSAV
jgi:hypothetical protein